MSLDTTLVSANGSGPSVNGSAAAPILQLESVEAGYGATVVLRDVELSVPAGSIVALLGANGAGKTTSLRIASGLLRPLRGRVVFDGEDVTALSASRRAARGMCLIPEGRGIFRRLTVRENLELFLPPWKSGSKAGALEAAITAFPVLGSRRNQIAGSLSGGEQQMLAVARAYLGSPKLILADELSMGLSPIVVDKIYESLQQLNETGVGLLVVEQYVDRALEMADYVYVLVRSRIVWSGPAKEMDEAMLTESYLGGA
ncbi:MAG TPA: ABC transporter ATP-binding protein [Candidatus Dormibacteraeota bacterium]|nr:ABC transporter ATP-binding protein [Candidatus Dormibacteraeota bacterium]